MNYHIAEDFSVFAFIINEWPDEDGRILFASSLSGYDAKGRRRFQVIYGTQAIDEILDICDDPHEVAYRG